MRPIACSLSLLVLTACGAKVSATAALNPPVIDSLPGGILRVKNVGPTAWTDTSGWKLVPTATINPPDGSAGEIGSVTAMALGDDGSVYLFQDKPATIKVYGPDGNYLRSIAREGDGPGELRTGMLGIHHDTLVVQDPNQQRMTFFKTDGTFLKTVPSTCCYYTTSLTIDSLGQIWSPGSIGAKGSGGWVRYRMDGSVRDTIMMPPTGETRASQKYWTVSVKNGNNSMSMMMQVPLQPYVEQFLRSDGALMVGTSETLSFAVLGNGKDSNRVFAADAPRIPMSEAERDSVFESVIEQQSTRYRDALRAAAKRDDLPKVWPAWTHVQSDGEARLWVSLPGARGDVTRLLVFDRNGWLLGEVPPPSAKMFKQSTWSRTGMAFLDEDDAGHAIIRVYKLNTTNGK